MNAVRSSLKGHRNAGTQTALAYPDISVRTYLQDMFHEQNKPDQLRSSSCVVNVTVNYIEQINSKVLTSNDMWGNVCLI